VRTIDTLFAAAYELELEVELPAAGGGPAQFFYPGAWEADSSDLLVKVPPFDGEPWLAAIRRRTLVYEPGGMR
jgi:hypothetical protein